MSSDKRLIPTNYKVLVNDLLSAEVNARPFYLFVGDHSDHQSQSTEQPADQIRTTLHDAYNKMLFGKKITSSDVKLLVRNIPYESGKVHDIYDDQDSALASKDFFCIVNAGSYYHLYKCLDNNMDSNSTVQPNFAHISGANTALYQTSDGYVWKYMYSVSDTDYRRFATTEYFPIVANSEVEAAATDGAIDMILIEDAGRGYDNHLEGQFSTGTLRINGNNRIYMITNNSASAVNGFYTNCLISIVSGTGIGQHRTVTDYYVNADGKYLVVNSVFDTALTTTSGYEIAPQVQIVGDRHGTTNALARALINSSSSNSIYKIEIVTRGANYQTANAYVMANSVVGVFSPASLRVMISPPGGHGSNAALELFSSHIAVTAKLQNTESNTIPIENGYQQIGLLYNPRFANVNFETKNSYGTFVASENVARFHPVKIETAATINTTSTTLSCNTADFTALAQGTYLYITDSAKSNHMIGVINTITNSSQLELASNGFFACTDCIVHLANISTQAVITDLVDVYNFRAGNVEGIFSDDDHIIGLASGAKAQINSISRNDDTKDFSTFIQMSKYHGDILSGTFANDETVYQSNAMVANALFHSISEANGVYTVYLSELHGQFQIIEFANTITGATSGAQLSLTADYNPELVHGSGIVIYLVNTEKTTRAEDQTELIRLIYEYN